MHQNFPRDDNVHQSSISPRQKEDIQDVENDADDELFGDFMKKLSRLAKIKRKKEKKVSLHRKRVTASATSGNRAGHYSKLTLKVPQPMHNARQRRQQQSRQDGYARGSGMSPARRARGNDNPSDYSSDSASSLRKQSTLATNPSVNHTKLSKAKASEEKLRKKINNTLSTVAVKVVPLDYVLRKTVARWRHDRLRHGLTTWKNIHNATKAYEQEVATAVHTIQRTGRGFLTSLKAKRLELANKIRAVTSLQTAVRGRIARHEYRHKVIMSRVDKMQAFARRYLARRRVRHLLRARLVKLLKVLAPLGRLSRLHGALKSMGKRQNQVRSALQMVGKAQSYRVRQLCRACLHMRAAAVDRKIAVRKQKQRHGKQCAARKDARAKQVLEADTRRRKLLEKRERQRLVAEQRAAAQREVAAGKAQAKRLKASEKHRKQVAEERLAKLLEARKIRNRKAHHQTLFKDLVLLGDNSVDQLSLHVCVKRKKLTGAAEFTISDPEMKTCAVSLSVPLPEEASGDYRLERERS